MKNLKEKWEYDKTNTAMYRQEIKNRLEDNYKDWFNLYEEFSANLDEKQMNTLNSIIFRY